MHKLSVTWSRSPSVTLAPSPWSSLTVGCLAFECLWQFDSSHQHFSSGCAHRERKIFKHIAERKCLWYQRKWCKCPSSNWLFRACWVGCWWWCACASYTHIHHSGQYLQRSGGLRNANYAILFFSAADTGEATNHWGRKSKWNVRRPIRSEIFEQLESFRTSNSLLSLCCCHQRGTDVVLAYEQNFVNWRGFWRNFICYLVTLQNRWPFICKVNTSSFLDTVATVE